jgi:alanine racemase
VGRGQGQRLRPWPGARHARLRRGRRPGPDRTDNALRLRELGWVKPILLLEGFSTPADVPLLAEHNINSAVHCIEQIKMLEYTQLYRPIDVHLKMNTGMNRLGFRPDEYAAAHARLRAIPGIRNITLMTHFANADDSSTRACRSPSRCAASSEGAAGLAGQRSLSNSAACCTRRRCSGKELHNDWVRPGIMLYGGTPGGGARPRTSACADHDPEIRDHRHPASEKPATRSATAAASRPRPDAVGVVACGYADGYPRHAPHGTPVLVDGVRTAAGGAGVDGHDDGRPDAGSPNARVGSKVTLWGDGLPIDEVAGRAGTIGYELMCALAPRVRVEGRVEGED